MDAVIDFIEKLLLSLDADIDSIVGVLKDNWFQPGNRWYQIGRGIQGIIRPIALTIVSICFVIEFLKITIQMDILKWEYALKCFFKLVFTKVCIDLATDLLSAIFATCSEWIDGVGTGTVNIGWITWGQVKNSIINAGMLEIIGIFLSSGIIFLGIKAVVIIIQVMAYARKFELCILMAIAPLPCAFLPLEDGGASRIPKKYIMTFASSCLSGLFMIMSVRLYSELVKETIENEVLGASDVGAMIGSVLLATLVLLMAIIKSGSWAQKILDVG